MMIHLFLNIQFIFKCFQITAVSQNIIVIIVNPVIKFNYITHSILISIWIAIVYYSICSIPISYIYRYRILCQHKSFSITMHISCLIIAGILAAINGFSFYYGFCWRTKEYLYQAKTLIDWFSTDEKATAIGISGPVSS